MTFSEYKMEMFLALQQVRQPIGETERVKKLLVLDQDMELLLLQCPQVNGWWLYAAQNLLTELSLSIFLTSVLIFDTQLQNQMKI